MDYKQKYKQLAQFIKDLYPFMSDYCKEKTEGMIPELKESKDERIKRCIRMCLTDVSEQRFKTFNTTLKDCLAWLEKQGEHANFRNKIQIGDKVTRNEDGVLVNLSQLKRMVKQREQKPTNEVEPKFKVKYAGSEYNVLEVKDIAGVTYYGIEDEPNHIDYVKAENCENISGYAIKENGSPYPAKPAVFAERMLSDKCEPKFHEGDWVVHEKIGVYKVIELCAFWYEVVDDKDNHYSIGYDQEYMCHLWTIQDAKDGDVLEFGDHGRLVIGILSFVNKNTGKVDVNCLLEGDKFKVGAFYNLDTINPHPATKEQRDLIFRKLKEAGYEWDSEKKELKKIKQKSAWSEEDERLL